VWDDGDALDGSRNGTLYTARFNPVTAALISGPTVLFQGASARLSYLTTTQNSKLLLYYKTAKNRGVYGRRSEDGGLTWQSAYPLVTGQVNSTSALEVVPYDGVHVSVAQLGSSTRTLNEVSMLQRTRPITSIVKHPTLANKYFIGEPSKFDNVTLVDNLRGGLVLSTDNTQLYHLDGVVQGVSDGIGAVSLLSVFGSTLSTAPGHTIGGGTRFLWKLDEASGVSTVVDAVGTYNLPTVSGTPVAEDGRVGGGRHFNNNTVSGPADTATVNRFNRTAGSWTMGFWIKIPSVDTGSTTRGVMTLCDGGNINTAVFYLKTAFGGLYMGSTAAGNAFTNIDFTGLSGQWVHCALAWNGTTMKAWRNGVALADSVLGAPSPSTLTTPTWLLGKGQDTSFVGQDMVLDDIWFENSLLTTAQILAEANPSAGPTGNGDDFNTYTLTPASVAINVELPGASFAVSLAVSSTHGYVAEYADNSGVLGQFVVVDLTTGTTGTVFTGVTAVRAVGVANFLTPTLFFVA